MLETSYFWFPLFVTRYFWARLWSKTHKHKTSVKVKAFSMDRRVKFTKVQLKGEHLRTRFNLQCSSWAFVFAAFGSPPRPLWSWWSNRFLQNRDQVWKPMKTKLCAEKDMKRQLECITSCCFRGRPLPLRWGSGADWAVLGWGDGSLVPLLLMSGSVHLRQGVWASNPRRSCLESY